jgi:hypothetical protein
MKKSALLAGMYALSVAASASEASFYDKEFKYDAGSTPPRKSQLTKKQKKARAAAKNARKQRRKNR